MTSGVASIQSINRAAELFLHPAPSTDTVRESVGRYGPGLVGIVTSAL